MFGILYISGQRGEMPGTVRLFRVTRSVLLKMFDQIEPPFLRPVVGTHELLPSDRYNARFSYKPQNTEKDSPVFRPGVPVRQELLPEVQALAMRTGGSLEAHRYGLSQQVDLERVRRYLIDNGFQLGQVCGIFCFLSVFVAWIVF